MKRKAFSACGLVISKIVLKVVFEIFCRINQFSINFFYLRGMILNCLLAGIVKNQNILQGLTLLISSQKLI